MKIAKSDLISRQEAITIPVMPKEHRHYQTNNLDDAYDQGWFDLQDCIEKLPSAEPERKKGRWIIHQDWLDEGLCGYECPNCGRCYDYPMNFCGFCGSPMEVEHEQN